MKKLFSYNCCICGKVETIRVKNNQEYKQDNTRCCYDCSKRFLTPYIEYINRHMGNGLTINLDEKKDDED